MMSMRCIEWTFLQEPPQRLQRPPVTKNADENNKASAYESRIFYDFMDLAFNPRGVGWAWSKGLKIPKENRPTSSRLAFAGSVLLSLAIHLLLFDIMDYAAQASDPSGYGSPAGGSIFLKALPLPQRLVWSTALTLLAGFVIYSAIQICYDIATLIGLALGQEPWQWPPVFYKPWLSTSLTEFWAQRWHQAFRRSFVVIGGRPLEALFGRVGAVAGAFIVSGILHDWGLRGMGSGSCFYSVAGYFIANGVGVILEGLYRQITGKRVGGSAGWVWCMVFQLITAHFIVNAWAERGLVGSKFIPEPYRPAKLLLGFLYSKSL